MEKGMVADQLSVDDLNNDEILAAHIAM